MVRGQTARCCRPSHLELLGGCPLSTKIVEGVQGMHSIIDVFSKVRCNA